METKYPIGINDLRHQPDHTTPKKLDYFKNIPLIAMRLDCF